MNSIEGKKPFPWRCHNCGEQAVYGATVDCSRKMHHDGREYTIKIDGLKTPKCVKCGQVLLDAEALGVLDVELRRQANILTPEQIHAYRTEAKLTQQELAAAVGVEEGFVEMWESGHFQTRTQDKLMRLLFGLPQVREMLTSQQVGKLGFSFRDNTLDLVGDRGTTPTTMIS